MTARLIFESTLIELSKVLAPSLKLYEFNYLFNKAINQYINKVYNMYDVNQLTTDDLRVLKATAYLEPKVSSDYQNATHGKSSAKLDGNSSVTNDNVTESSLTSKYKQLRSLNGSTFEVELPNNYLHLLNCVCVYYVAKQKDCWDAGTYILIPATRLTADAWSLVVTDIYNRPSPMKPYYYIHNQQGVSDSEWKYKVEQTMTDDGVKPDSGANPTEKDNTGGKSNLPRTFEWNGAKDAGSLVEKPIATRVSNASRVTCEIRYGRDSSVFQLVEVQIDYVKSPLFIRLTQELIDLTEDTSQMMEFPDYVNLEIINELVHLVMERTSDPRLQTNMQISQSIARPTQQLQQPALALA